MAPKIYLKSRTPFRSGFSYDQRALTSPLNRDGDGKLKSQNLERIWCREQLGRRRNSEGGIVTCSTGTMLVIGAFLFVGASLVHTQVTTTFPPDTTTADIYSTTTFASDYSTSTSTSSSSSSSGDSGSTTEEYTWTTTPNSNMNDWIDMEQEESDKLVKFVVTEIQKLKKEHKELDDCQNLDLSSVLSGKKQIGKPTKYSVTLKVQPQLKEDENCQQHNATLINMHPEICEADIVEGDRGGTVRKTLIRSTCLQVEELQD